MPRVKLFVARKSQCLQCGHPVRLAKSVCPYCKAALLPRCNAGEMYRLFLEGHIIDARAGGFVIGRNHNEDDIPMISVVAHGIFQLSGVMQGGEYVVNRHATIRHMDRLKEINSHKGSECVPMQSIDLSDKSRVFNANGIRGRLALLIDSGSFIINRAATTKYYRELVELNCSIIQELKGGFGF